MLVDTHAHLSDRRLASDLEHWLQEARAAGIRHIVNVGADWESSRIAAEQAANHSELVAAVGVHPHEARHWNAQMEEDLIALAQHPKVCAYGEIGLDYYYDHSSRSIQQEVFKAQLRIAKELDLPVIVHDRDAHGDVLAILQQHAPFKAGGVMHCYSGSAEMVPDFLALGFYISFAGPITFRNAKKPALAALKVPDDRLLVETDCPYLSPEPFRGKLNHPARVALVARRLAELRGVDYATLAQQTTANAARLFGLERGD
ncbi:MAG TPA: TatD family hydrolase [Firmicutes bacterium]|nr:TatD family hydrolase [Bacillota bacterium]